MIINNVTRLLDSHDVSYVAHELPGEKLSAREVSDYLGVPLGQVFKTIVVVRKRPGKPILAMVPGTADVDLKTLARTVGEKKLMLPSQKETESITNLQVGGISPLALINRGFQTVLDTSAHSFQSVYISGGQRGLNIQIPVIDLIRLTRAEAAIISINNSNL
ncbi:MAG: YbaK/EbsC family protein [Chloroflexota bacterium]|nr:YbaK/EbsC family protein [Chloroflexota bacterium]